MSPSTTEPGTGYEIPGIPLPPKSVACRFHLENIKEFKGEGGKTINQIGQIRVDIGSAMPILNQQVKITEATESGSVIDHFQGVIMDIYHGQLTWRLDV